MPVGGDLKREMHTEISALVGAIARAFALSDSEAAGAVERGAVAMDFGRDANGNWFVVAVFDGRTARIDRGAVKYPKAKDPTAADK
jgi:hypothetical protein